jgi:hypothetical protein
MDSPEAVADAKTANPANVILQNLSFFAEIIAVPMSASAHLFVFVSRWLKPTLSRWGESDNRQGSTRYLTSLGSV